SRKTHGCHNSIANQKRRRRWREGGKQGGREERGLEARIPAADGPERGTQTPLPIRACSPSARSRTGGGPERDVRRGGPSLKARNDRYAPEDKRQPSPGPLARG
ncbi:unnamed protein product, partial [Prorocentrum cordatum]